MKTLFRKYLNFIKGVSVTTWGKIGVILTTSAFISFLFFEVLRLLGILTNAYLGLVTYLLFPSLFILGLILIPFGWHIYKKKRGLTSRQLLEERFIPEDVRENRLGAPVFRLVLVLTAINILFISAAGFRTLKFMDESRFCGTACHRVMNPEWTTYQVSPHARVKCVQCHVGEGVKALVDSKLSGLRQLVKETFDTYQRPIPTPVRQLRPARETCEKCHWPEKFYGHRLKIITRYALDETSSPRYTTLDLKIDTGKRQSRAGIHWHIGQDNQVRYISKEDKREEVLWLEVVGPGRPLKRYVDRRYSLAVEKGENSRARVMDCVDCHNRATHIYEEPAAAIDDRFDQGKLDRSLPFAKRELLHAITIHYPDRPAAMKGIALHLQGFYRRFFPQVAGHEMAAIDRMIAVGREIYCRNIHPRMAIDWGTYPSFIGHAQGSGCFRCHNENMQDKNGQVISHDCTSCHSLLAYDEDTPFKYLEIPRPGSPNYPLHVMLREEFLTGKRTPPDKER